jgi:hypothetical protein
MVQGKQLNISHLALLFVPSCLHPQGVDMHLMWNLRGIDRDDGAGDVEDLRRCILCIGAGSRLLGLIK